MIVLDILLIIGFSYAIGVMFLPLIIQDVLIGVIHDKWIIRIWKCQYYPIINFVLFVYFFIAFMFMVIWFWIKRFIWHIIYIEDYKAFYKEDYKVIKKICKKCGSKRIITILHCTEENGMEYICNDCKYMFTDKDLKEVIK